MVWPVRLLYIIIIIMHDIILCMCGAVTVACIRLKYAVCSVQAFIILYFAGGHNCC